MPVRALRFAHVSEMKFIHQTVAERPGVGQIVLLEALLNTRAKTGNIRSRSLKVVKGIKKSVVREIIVGAEILFVADAMVEPYGGLVLTITSVQHGLK